MPPLPRRTSSPVPMWRWRNTRRMAERCPSAGERTLPLAREVCTLHSFGYSARIRIRVLPILAAFPP